MTTFHQWLTDQQKRTDQTGQLARLWRSYDHQKLSGLASVTRSLRDRAQFIAGNQAYADRDEGARAGFYPQGAEWIEPAIAAATAEYREGKSPSPEAVAGNATRLADIEAQLRLLIRGQSMIMIHLGVGPLEALEPLEPEDPEPAAGDNVVSITRQYAEAWQALYEAADHAAAEGA